MSIGHTAARIRSYSRSLVRNDGTGLAFRRQNTKVNRDARYFVANKSKGSVTKMIGKRQLDWWRSNCVSGVIITTLEAISSRLDQLEDAPSFPIPQPPSSIHPHFTRTRLRCPSTPFSRYVRMIDYFSSTGPFVFPRQCHLRSRGGSMEQRELAKRKRGCCRLRPLEVLSLIRKFREVRSFRVFQ